jgi:hypothetical protein
MNILWANNGLDGFFTYVGESRIIKTPINHLGTGPPPCGPALRIGARDDCDSVSFIAMVRKIF